MEVAIKKIVKDVLERVHPNNYEILKYSDINYYTELVSYERDNLKGNTFNVLIHYPKIDITNSLEHKHTIYNLFVIVQFKEEVVIKIKGFRTTMSIMETISGYSHSHLPSAPKNKDITDFCIGYSTNLQSFTRKVIHTEEMFESFIHSLDSFLAWESIEGVPFINIISIGYMFYNYTLEDFYQIVTTDKFKKELYNCIELYDCSDKYIKVNIKVSEKLIQLAPLEYKYIMFDNDKYIKREVIDSTPNNYKQEYFTTKKFNLPIQIINDNPNYNIVFKDNISENIIIQLEDIITRNLNNIILWNS